jgi:histidinol dehydrogenase
LAQAEHDADAQVMLITFGPDTAALIDQALKNQLETLPRKDIATVSLDSGRVIIVDDLETACLVSNLYAPEHLSLQVRDPESFIAHITACGTIFAGDLAAETFGDYILGPSHVLPTDSAARAYDGITIRSFMTSFVVQSLNPVGLDAIAAKASKLARLEGLEAHARASDIRLGL